MLVPKLPSVLVAMTADKNAVGPLLNSCCRPHFMIDVCQKSDSRRHSGGWQLIPLADTVALAEEPLLCWIKYASDVAKEALWVFILLR